VREASLVALDNAWKRMDEGLRLMLTDYVTELNWMGRTDDAKGKEWRSDSSSGQNGPAKRRDGGV
jgi:hypothetical protein